VHALPSDLHEGLSGAQTPFVHFWPQHSVPPASPAQAALSAVQCVALQNPAVHMNVQQSVGSAQDVPAWLHDDGAESQVLVFVLQMPLQHWAPPVHVWPNVPHSMYTPSVGASPTFWSSDASGRAPAAPPPAPLWPPNAAAPSLLASSAPPPVTPGIGSPSSPPPQPIAMQVLNSHASC
jgi:hypothetical protein